jgi:hypothetical protein
MPSNLATNNECSDTHEQSRIPAMESHVHLSIYSQIGVQTAQRPGYPHPITVYNMETEVTS